MGGPYPSQSPPRRLYSRAHGNSKDYTALWVGSKEYTREEARTWLYHLFPGVSSQMAPQNARGPLEVLVGLFTDFPDFLGRSSSRSRVSFTWLLVYIYVFFFSEIVLWRNYLINHHHHHHHHCHHHHHHHESHSGPEKV